jgi:hypothetical protein
MLMLAGAILVPALGLALWAGRGARGRAARFHAPIR